MITVRGRQFSEDTIVAALKAHCNWLSYKPEAGDVLSSGPHSIRIMIETGGKLQAFGNDGRGVLSLSGLETAGYKKIGRISDIKI